MKTSLIILATVAHTIGALSFLYVAGSYKRKKELIVNMNELDDACTDLIMRAKNLMNEEEQKGNPNKIKMGFH